MENWRKSELQQTLSEVARRCTVDLEFRSLALRDAAAAIAKVNPKPLPDGVQFKFVDNTGCQKTVVLPDPLGKDSDELSEESLESVAGGGDNPPITISGGWSKLPHRGSGS
jgi:hypothetical protein